MVLVRYDKDKLYSLLPSIYRQRDPQEKPLYSLLSIMAEQIGILEDDIQNLYNNWFIETCDDWVVPYIADLLRVRGIHPSTGGPSQRAYVANTISYRRAKGTKSILERLAYDITNWNSKAVEFFQLLYVTQYLNHLRPQNYRVDIRDSNQLELLDTPFDSIPHTVDVRQISKPKTDLTNLSVYDSGFYNIHNIGLFLWRLKSYPLIDSPAYPHDKSDAGSKRFSFNILGYDLPLYNFVPDAGTSKVISEVTVEGPIRRLELYDDFDRRKDGQDFVNKSSNYYGDETDSKSIIIKVDNQIIPENNVQVCDLSDWKNVCFEKDKIVAIDPHLGRILFAENKQDVQVNYYYGFSDDLGGGFYERPSSNYNLTKANAAIVKISESDPVNKNLQNAIQNWDRKENIIFEIQDSQIYNENLTISLPPGLVMEIRSSQGQRPLLMGSISVNGGENSKLVLDGLMMNNPQVNPTTLSSSDLITISDDTTENKGNLGELVIRHCTLVSATYLFNWNNLPGFESLSFLYFLKNNFGDLFSWIDENSAIEKTDNVVKISKKNSTSDCTLTLNKQTVTLQTSQNGNLITFDFAVKNEKGELNIYLENSSVKVKGKNNDLKIILENTVCGRLDMLGDSTSVSEASLQSTNSIIDSKDNTGSNYAIRCYAASVEDCTVFGKTSVTIMKKASNSIFTDQVSAIRTQQGCIRYSYLPNANNLPRFYKCQPSENSDRNIVPIFTSEKYGDPGYAQLQNDIRKEIFEGADNKQEMGVFNHLYQPQRIHDLLLSFEEYLRFGLEAGVFLVT